MQILEKEKTFTLNKNLELTNKEKVLSTKYKFQKNGESYSIKDAYKIGLSKLIF